MIYQKIGLPEKITKILMNVKNWIYSTNITEGSDTHRGPEQICHRHMSQDNYGWGEMIMCVY